MPFAVAALLRKKYLRITVFWKKFGSGDQRLIAEREPSAFL